MTQVVSETPYALESSMQLSRPEFKSFLEPDSNIGKTDVTEYNALKNYNQLHVPKSTGPLDYTVTCCDNNLAVSAPMPIMTKRRTENRILDPCSGFISPAGEALLNTGRNGMRSMGKVKIEPQTMIPQNVHSIRTRTEAIDELKRVREGEDAPELKWNSQKILDIVLKSRLGGWTSEAKINTDTTTETKKPYRLREIFPNMKIKYFDENERDGLAKNYLYTTSTQQAYSQVHWDSKLPKKLHAPVTTNEYAKADPLKQYETNKPQIWQTVAGNNWDRVQARESEFHREDVAFTSRTKRGNHIPGYAGHIGAVGYNLHQMDDVIEKFQPLTVLRTQQPKEPEPNYKPNIPGYTGRVHQFKTTSVSHYDAMGRPYTTTAAYHREMPPNSNFNSIETTSLAGDFSRIQTKVPPQNAFDNIKRPVEGGINNSIDDAKHPIVNPKFTNHQSFLVKNREAEIKSILKK